MRQTSTGYDYDGTMLGVQDAANLGVDTIEQADISVARDNAIRLVVTPIIPAADLSHEGYMMFSIDDFATASISI